MMRFTPLVLLLAACTAPDWLEPSASTAMICDAAAAQANIGPASNVDRRPRPECRPVSAAPTR